MSNFTSLHLKPYKVRVALYLLSLIVAVALTIATALSVADFLKLLFGDSSLPETNFNVIASWLDKVYLWLISFGKTKALLMFSMLLMLTYGLKNVFSYLAALMSSLIRINVTRDIRNQLYEKMIGLPVGYFVSNKKGEVLARFSSDTSEYDENVLGSLQLLCSSAISILMYLSVLFYLDFRLTLFTLATFPIVALIVSSITRKLKRKSVIMQEKNASLMATIEETIAGVKAIKVFQAYDYINNSFDKNNEDYTALRTRVQRRIYLASPISDFLGNTIVIVILLFGAMLIFNGAGLSPELFISYIVMFVLMIPPAKDLATSVAQIKRGGGCVERIEDFLSIDDAQSDTEKSAQITFHSFSKSIEFKNVWFTYNDEPVPHWALEDVSLSIPKGSKVAITGSSGSGKSTLADLMMGFIECSRGSITVDGEPLSTYNINSWRSKIGFVEQETVLFADTIEANIAYGLPDATHEQVVEAAKIACAHEFIMQLPDGYKSMIGDSGCTLSGGQRQRISIARAVLRNPSLLILDEATSALDASTEAQVQQALNQAMKDRTSFIIAHRLSTLVSSDVIIVLEKGKIVEQGSHEELINSHGRYAQLWYANPHGTGENNPQRK